MDKMDLIVGIICKQSENCCIKNRWNRGSMFLFILFPAVAALLLAYTKGNGPLCRSLISSGAVLGTLNSQGISLFNCQVASKQLLFRLLDFLSSEPKWGEGDSCQECSNKFGITNRKHHW